VPAPGGLLPGLTGSAAADPAAPGADASKPSGRVSDAFDFYNSQLDKTGALLSSLLGNTDAASPAPTTSPAPAAASAGGPDLTAPAPEALPAAEAPAASLPAPDAQTAPLSTAEAPAAPAPADPVAAQAPAAPKASQPEVWLPSKGSSVARTPTGSTPQERVSDARDLYESQNSTASVISG
jgi:hypothetical protein